MTVLTFLSFQLLLQFIVFSDFFPRTLLMTGLAPNLTHKACCTAPGVGGNCGDRGSHGCDDREQYVYWDGIHFTESFYRQIAEFVLNGEFSDPPINLAKVCDLTFEDFGDTTYEEVYPSSSSLVSDV